MMLGSGAVYLYSIVFAIIFPYFNDQLRTCQLAHKLLYNPAQLISLHCGPVLGFAVVLTTAISWILAVFGVSDARLMLHARLSLTWCALQVSVPIYFGLKWRQSNAPSYAERTEQEFQYESDEEDMFLNQNDLKQGPAFPTYGAIKE